ASANSKQKGEFGDKSNKEGRVETAIPPKRRGGQSCNSRFGFTNLLYRSPRG
ncbi:hypothetical protein COCVIDRAFT_92568, partial [Bipolaris victoriae FI3]